MFTLSLEIMHKNIHVYKCLIEKRRRRQDARIKKEQEEQEEQEEWGGMIPDGLM
jgi:hypothetical protein